MCMLLFIKAGPDVQAKTVYVLHAHQQLSCLLGAVFEHSPQNYAMHYIY